mgnify:CR=1 FL=1
MFTKNTMAVVVTVICVFLLVTGMPGAHAQVPTGDESLLTTTCSASTNPCAGQTYPLTVQTGVYACYSNGYFGTDAAAAVAVGAQACTQEQLEATEEYTINDWCNIPFTYPSAFPAANLHGWDAKCCECIANSLFATQPDYCVNISGAGENFVYGMFQAGCSTAAEQLLEESFLNVGQGTNVCNPVVREDRRLELRACLTLLHKNYFMVVGSMWANDPNIGMPTVNGYPTPLYNWSMWPQCSQCTNSSGGSCCVQAPAAASTLLVGTSFLELGHGSRILTSTQPRTPCPSRVPTTATPPPLPSRSPSQWLPSLSLRSWWLWWLCAAAVDSSSNSSSSSCPSRWSRTTTRVCDDNAARRKRAAHVYSHDLVGNIHARGDSTHCEKLTTRCPFHRFFSAPSSPWNGSPPSSAPRSRTTTTVHSPSGVPLTPRSASGVTRWPPSSFSAWLRLPFFSRTCFSTHCTISWSLCAVVSVRTCVHIAGTEKQVLRSYSPCFFIMPLCV